MRKEVKGLVRQKKTSNWNEVIERAKADFEGSTCRKEFWAFVSGRSKGKKKNIAPLKNKGGISVTSMRGKLQILRSHYERLGKVSEGSDFDDNWKEEVEDRVNNCKCASELYEDEVLHKG